LFHLRNKDVPPDLYCAGALPGESVWLTWQ